MNETTNKPPSSIVDDKSIINTDSVTEESDIEDEKGQIHTGLISYFLHSEGVPAYLKAASALSTAVFLFITFSIAGQFKTTLGSNPLQTPNPVSTPESLKASDPLRLEEHQALQVIYDKVEKLYATDFINSLISAYTTTVPLQILAALIPLLSCAGFCVEGYQKGSKSLAEFGSKDHHRKLMWSWGGMTILIVFFLYVIAVCVWPWPLKSVQAGQNTNAPSAKSL